MSYSIEMKNEVKERLQRREKVKDISEQMKISVSTIYKWKKKFTSDIEKDETKEKSNLNANTKKSHNGENKKPSWDEVKTSKEIKKLIGARRYKEAIRLTQKYPLNPVIQSQRIGILIRGRKYTEARNIGNRPEFINDAPIQSQMIAIDIQEGKYEEARKKGNRPEFIKNEAIQSQMKTIDNQKRNSCQPFVNEIKTKLYYNRINQKDIEAIKNTTQLSEDERIWILLAIFENTKNRLQVKQLSKEYKKNHPESKNNKIINTILQRAESKKASIFDFGFYDALLNWSLDPNLKNKYEEERKRQKEEKHSKKPVVNMPKKTKAIEPNNTSTTNLAIKTPRNHANEFRDRIIVIPQERGYIEKVAKERVKKESNYFNEILKYLNEKRKIIYVNAQSTDYKIQKTAISQWDRMEILLEKVKNNENNTEYLNKLYAKILQLQKKEGQMR